MIFNQKMNEDDWQNISTLWGTLTFKSLEKLVDIKVYNAAQLSMTARTMEEVADQRGYARGLKEIIKEIERADKKVIEIGRKKKNESNK